MDTRAVADRSGARWRRSGVAGDGKRLTDANKGMVRQRGVGRWHAPRGTTCSSTT